MSIFVFFHFDGPATLFTLTHPPHPPTFSPLPPTHAAASSRWSTLAVPSHPTAMPDLLKRVHSQTWRSWHNALLLEPLVTQLGLECDLLVRNETAMNAIREYGATFIVGDAMNPCAAVLSELLHLPRAEVHVGPLVRHMHTAPWTGSGRDWPIEQDLWGTPTADVALVPPFSSPLHLLRNFAWAAAEAAIDWVTVRPATRALHARHGVDLSTPAAIGRNALLIINSDAAWEHPLRLPAGVVLAGSITATPAAAPLPQDVQAWMVAAAAHGDKILYVSLGSIFQLPPGHAAELVTGLAALPNIAVLAKFTAAELSDEAVNTLPPTVKILRWAPQNDILASTAPRVSLFVSHGGANGVGEALYHGVPLVVAPQGAEQLENAVKVAASGFGLSLLRRKPPPASIVDATSRALASLDVLTARARAAQARARVARPTGALVAAVATERAALLGEGARVPLPQEGGGVTVGGVVAAVVAACAAAPPARALRRVASPSRRKTD